MRNRFFAIIRVIVCPSVLSGESMELAFLVVIYLSRYSWACIHAELGLGSLLWSISSLQKYSAQTTCFGSTEEIIQELSHELSEVNGHATSCILKSILS